MNIGIAKSIDSLRENSRDWVTFKLVMLLITQTLGNHMEYSHSSRINTSEHCEPITNSMFC